MLRATDFEIINENRPRIIVTLNGVTWKHANKKSYDEKNIRLEHKHNMIYIWDEDKGRVLHIISMPFVIDIEDGFEVGEYANK